MTTWNTLDFIFRGLIGYWLPLLVAAAIAAAIILW